MKFLIALIFYIVVTIVVNYDARRLQVEKTRILGNVKLSSTNWATSVFFCGVFGVALYLCLRPKYVSAQNERQMAAASRAIPLQDIVDDKAWPPRPHDPNSN